MSVLRPVALIAVFVVGAFVTVRPAGAQPVPPRSAMHAAPAASPGTGPEAHGARPALSKAQVEQAMLRGTVPASPALRERSRSTSLLVLSDVEAGVAGAAIGGGLGYATFDEGSDAFVPTGALLGTGAGLLFGVPLGVHLANGRRGNYLLGFLASAGAGLGSAALLASVLDTQHPTQSTLAAGASLTLQIGTSVAVERATAR